MAITPEGHEFQPGGPIFFESLENGSNLGLVRFLMGNGLAQRRLGDGIGLVAQDVWLDDRNKFIETDLILAAGDDLPLIELLTSDLPGSPKPDETQGLVTECRAIRLARAGDTPLLIAAYYETDLSIPEYYIHHFVAVATVPSQRRFDDSEAVTELREFMRISEFGELWSPFTS